jgi:hypothetical protein
MRLFSGRATARRVGCWLVQARTRNLPLHGSATNFFSSVPNHSHAASRLPLGIPTRLLLPQRRSAPELVCAPLSPPVIFEQPATSWGVLRRWSVGASRPPPSAAAAPARRAWNGSVARCTLPRTRRTHSDTLQPCDATADTVNSCRY